MDIVSGVAAASQALGIARTLRGIEKDYDAATYKAQIVDLIDALTDAKMALTDARELLAERDKEVARLKAGFEEKAALIKGVGDYNYFTDESGKALGYPACPRCEAIDGRIIRIKRHGPYDTARCPACATIYTPVEEAWTNPNSP